MRETGSNAPRIVSLKNGKKCKRTCRGKSDKAGQHGLLGLAPPMPQSLQTRMQLWAEKLQVEGNFSMTADPSNRLRCSSRTDRAFSNAKVKSCACNDLRRSQPRNQDRPSRTAGITSIAKAGQYASRTPQRLVETGCKSNPLISRRRSRLDEELEMIASSFATPHAVEYKRAFAPNGTSRTEADPD